MHKCCFIENDTEEDVLVQTYFRTDLLCLWRVQSLVLLKNSKRMLSWKISNSINIRITNTISNLKTYPINIKTESECLVSEIISKSDKQPNLNLDLYSALILPFITVFLGPFLGFVFLAFICYNYFIDHLKFTYLITETSLPTITFVNDTDRELILVAYHPYSIFYLFFPEFTRIRPQKEYDLGRWSGYEVYLRLMNTSGRLLTDSDKVDCKNEKIVLARDILEHYPLMNDAWDFKGWNLLHYFLYSVGVLLYIISFSIIFVFKKSFDLILDPIGFYNGIHDFTVYLLQACKSRSSISDKILRNPKSKEDYIESQRELQRAASEHEYSIVNSLLKVQGLDINFEDSFGRSPFMNAILNSENNEWWVIQKTVKRLLKESRLNISLKDKDGNSVLHLGAKGHAFVFNDLINTPSIQNQLLNSKNNDLKTPLMIAINNKIQNAFLLIETGKVDVSIKDKDGNDALFMAKQILDQSLDNSYRILIDRLERYMKIKDILQISRSLIVLDLKFGNDDQEKSIKKRIMVHSTPNIRKRLIFVEGLLDRGLIGSLIKEGVIDQRSLVNRIDKILKR